MRLVMLASLCLVALSSLCAASGLEIQLGTRNSAPKPVVYCPSETQVVVYDARCEVGVAMEELGAAARELARGLGMRLVRHTLYWNRMETTEKPGVYDSKYLDEWNLLTATCRKEGLYLDVVIEGDPPGVGFANRAESYQRLAQFAADMARRFPSVVYWEILDNVDSNATSLLGANDGTTMSDRGKFYAEMLKTVYPAVKAANPSAWILTGGAGDPDFTRGLYEAGAAHFFDILTVHTADSTFADQGKQFRAVMAANGDDTKPIWNTGFGARPTQGGSNIFDGAQLESFRTCLPSGEDSGIYQKVITCPLQSQITDGADFGLVRRDQTFRPAYTWLLDKQVNKALLEKSRNTAGVLVHTGTAMIPVGYDYKQTDDGLEILRVVVDSLEPTRIALMHAPEPDKRKPSNKPASPKPNGVVPPPDPFDI